MDDGYKAEIKCSYVRILGLQVSGEPAILINIFLPFERSGVFISRGIYVHKTLWIVCHSQLSSGNCIYKNVSFPVWPIDSAQQ